MRVVPGFPVQKVIRNILILSAATVAVVTLLSIDRHVSCVMRLRVSILWSAAFALKIAIGTGEQRTTSSEREKKPDRKSEVRPGPQDSTQFQELFSIPALFGTYRDDAAKKSIRFIVESGSEVKSVGRS